MQSIRCQILTDAVLPYIDRDFISRQEMGHQREAGLFYTVPGCLLCNCLFSFCLQLLCFHSHLLLLKCYPQDRVIFFLDWKCQSQVVNVYNRSVCFQVQLVYVSILSVGGILGLYQDRMACCSRQDGNSIGQDGNCN